MTQFARSEQTVSLINKRDLNVLGRRLYAAFERKADKVEFINPGIAPDLAEDTLTLVQSRNKRNRGKPSGACTTAASPRWSGNTSRRSSAAASCSNC